MADKNSRLVNLVIALLAAKKFLTKAQIFQAVPGFDGTEEAKDRMFERDKEELRSLGIQIEIKSIDPFFEDELGYRIFPDRYKFDLGPLTAEEVALLALAAEAWRETALRDIAHSTLIRLESLGVNSDFTDLPLVPTLKNVPNNFPELLESANNRKIVEFSYPNQEGVSELRRVEPLGIYSQRMRWYLFAFDSEKGETRSFRLDRIEGQVKQTNKAFPAREYEIPKQHFEPLVVKMEIRRDFCHELVSKSKVIVDGEEWHTALCNFDSEAEALATILKFSPNVKVLDPIELVEQVKSALNEILVLHEHQ